MLKTESTTVITLSEKKSHEEHILYDSIYVKCPKKGKYIEIESRLVLSRAGNENGEWLSMDMRFLFRLKEML